MGPAVDSVSAELGVVQETLLIPLYMRARETERPDRICRDEKAAEIIRRLDYDFTKFEQQGESMQLDIAVRTEILDEIVGNYLRQHPDAMVVNLGAGLDGRFQRLDNGRVVWFEVDLPDVIELRRRFYRETLRNPFVSASVLNQIWIDALGWNRGQPLLLLAEGLLPYLNPADVWRLFARIADSFPGADFVFQSINPSLVHQQQRVPAVNQTAASFEWGIRSGVEVIERDTRYRLVEEWFYLDRHGNRWEPILRRWWFVTDIRQQMREMMKITHVRVSGG